MHRHDVLLLSPFDPEFSSDIHHDVTMLRTGTRDERAHISEGEKDMHEVTLGCVLLSLSPLLSSPPHKPPLPVKTCGIRRDTHPGNELTRERERERDEKAEDGKSE